MVMGIPIDEIIRKIGHDGSKIVFPELIFPLCHAGFDIQEIIDVAFQHGWSVTGVESRPHLTPDGEHTRELYTPEQVEERMSRYFDNYSGLVAGLRHDGRWYHNVAWDHESQQWFDPSGPVLPRETPPIKIAVFHIFQKTDKYFANTFFQEIVSNGRR
jgi:hypothetical protein